MTVTPTPVPVPAPVESVLEQIESFLVKAGAVASIVVGALAAAKGWLPSDVSVVLTAVGPAVFTVERYWDKIAKYL